MQMYKKKRIQSGKCAFKMRSYSGDGLKTSASIPFLDI